MHRRPLKYRTPGQNESGQAGAGGDNEPNGVRGPNSALTAFLRQQGINANDIRDRYLQRMNNLPEGQEQEGEEVAEGENSGDEHGRDQGREDDQQEEEEEEDDEEEAAIRLAARQKRGLDDNDSDEEEVETRKKIVGEEEDCAICASKFIINVYSKSNDEGYLCANCTNRQLEKERSIKKNQLLSRKKRQKLAVALLDRQNVKLPTLQDLSIRKVTAMIEYVDQFGDIGLVNLKKIAKILCRNRSLDDNTLQLFLENGVNLEKLEFWDCSKLTSKSYNKIGSFCPNLTSITFLMCGRFHNDNLNYFTTNLQNLTSIELDGPFLINKNTWQNFFLNKKGSALKKFKVSNTHRLDDEIFQIFSENLGGSITDLRLSRLDGIQSKTSYDLMPVHFTSLENLEISYPNHEDLVDDSLIINLLSINGEKLTSLNLDGCSGLTDEVLINGIHCFGSNIRSLSLQFLDQLTNEGFVGLFHEWSNNFGLNELYLKKCFQLADEGIIEVLLHSNTSLVELSLNSVKDLTVQTFQVMKCPNLTYLDAGFVRCIDDDVLKIIGDNCPQLKIMDCYGNNRCTSKAEFRDGLTVIGRQSDTV